MHSLTPQQLHTLWNSSVDALMSPGEMGSAGELFEINARLYLAWRLAPDVQDVGFLIEAHKEGRVVGNQSLRALRLKDKLVDINGVYQDADKCLKYHEKAFRDRYSLSSTFPLVVQLHDLIALGEREIKSMMWFKEIDQVIEEGLSQLQADFLVSDLGDVTGSTNKMRL